MTEPVEAWTSAAVALVVAPQWRGAQVTGERGTDQRLRERMIEAQREVCAELFASCTPDPVRMRLWWEVSATTDSAASVAWNPQAGVPLDAALLICRGEAR